LGGLAYSILTAAAFPPFNLWWIAFFAILPMAWVAREAGRGSARLALPILSAGAGTLLFWIIEQRWVINISELGFIPMVGYLALTSALAFAGIAFLVRRFPRAPMTLVVPCVWVGVEYFRGAVMWDGYPWYMAAHPLIEFPVLAAPAAWLGAYFVSQLVAMVGGGLLDVLSKPAGRGPRAIGLVGIILAAAVWTVAGLSRPDLSTQSMRIAAIQTNVATAVKNEWTPEQRVTDFREFLRLTREAATSKPSLIVWPETMYPGYFIEDESLKSLDRSRVLAPSLVENIELFRDALLSIQRIVAIPMIVGASAYENLELVSSTEPGGIEIKQSRRFNSAFLVNGGKVDPTPYSKLHLTPFGETMPYISEWPWLERVMLNVGVGASGMRFDLSRGSSPLVFELPVEGRMVSIATPICFEVTVPSVCRRLVSDHGKRRADLMVQLTNDGWFGTQDAGRWQHLQLARWRAVELATPIVRVANTGVSAAVDARGRLIASGIDGQPGASRVAGILTADIPLAGARLPMYASVGDVVGWLSLTALILWTLAATLRRRPVTTQETSA
jgi:apolipoprotein N-acyltransferase